MRCVQVRAHTHAMRRRRWALLTGLVIAWVALVEISAAIRDDPLSLLSLVAGVVLALSGFLLSRDPEQSRVARLLLLAAALNAVANVRFAAGRLPGRPGPFGDDVSSWAHQLSQAGTFWCVVPLTAVFLLYPGHRFERQWYRWLVIAAAAVFVGLFTAESLAYSRKEPKHDFTVLPAWIALIPGGEPVRAVLEQLSWWAGAMVAIVTGAVIASRWRSAKGPVRDAVRSVAVAGTALAAALTAQLISAVLGPEHLGLIPQSWSNISSRVTVGMLALVPMILLFEALRRRAQQVRILDDLLTAGGNPVAVEGALRRVLDDPLLSVAFLVDGRWVDVAGTDVTDWVDNGAASGRARREIVDTAGSQGAVVDAVNLEGDPALLRTVLQAAAVVLDNTRLQAALAARLRELAASRSRLVEAGLTERRQVERDLHDGAQQQLLAVAATLARAGLATGEDAVRAAVVEARGQLSDALAELRNLARGIYPAVLSQGGLTAALPTLAETAPVAIDFDLPANLRGVRLGQAVESTAWFVAVESVANAAKHARCSLVRISLRLDENAGDDLKQLVLRVSDDGSGGAALVSDGGLAGLVDRAGAIGGSLTVISKIGVGTTVEAVLPCAS